MPVPRMVPEILVANWQEMGFQTQPTKLFNEIRLMHPALVKNSNARTWTNARDIFQRKDFYCIVKTPDDIRLRKPNRLKSRI